MAGIRSSDRSASISQVQNVTRSDPVAEREEQSAADTMIALVPITSNASDVSGQVNVTCCSLNEGISSGDFFILVLLSALDR